MQIIALIPTKKSVPADPATPARERERATPKNLLRHLPHQRKAIPPTPYPELLRPGKDYSENLLNHLAILHPCVAFRTNGRIDTVWKVSKIRLNLISAIRAFRKLNRFKRVVNLPVCFLPSSKQPFKQLHSLTSYALNWAAIGLNSIRLPPVLCATLFAASTSLVRHAS